MKIINENEIIQWTKGIKISDNVTVTITNISTDSRTIKNGDFFVPIKGEKMDGHDFIAEIVKKGASGFVTDRDVSDDIKNSGVLIVKVADTNQALLDMAEGYLKNFNIPIVAITGSVGKTTTKEMVYSVLKQKYNVLKTEGNYNNQIGLPLTVFGLDDIHEVAILEMGMNNFGEIETLSKVARPDIALITNIGDSHIGNLGSRDGILKAKSEIFKYIKDSGVAILNGDDEYLKKIKIKNEIKNVGENNTNDCYCYNMKCTDSEHAELTLNLCNEEVELKVNTTLNYITYPITFAAMVGKLLNLTSEQIKRGIESFELPGRRYAKVELNDNITIIDDCYNASLLSIKIAIETTINTYPNRRKIVILGDILELGSFSEEKHRELGVYLKDKNVELLIFIGKEVKYAYEQIKDFKTAYYFSEKREAYEFLDQVITQNDVILVKASNGNKFNEIVNHIKSNNT